jgi:hypothetical protein
MLIKKENIDKFFSIFKREFPNENKEYLFDCAIIAAFLQQKDVFEELYKQFGDRKVMDAYLDGLLEDINLSRSPKNVLMRAFCKLMSNYGFCSQYHPITFTGDASKTFAAVVKNRMLFKDLIGQRHGQYTHTLQWFGVCLLFDRQDLIEKNHGLLNRPGDLYQYMVSPVTANEFPGEFVNGKQKGKSKKTLWDLCVDCFVGNNDIKEDYGTNLYTDSYRSPANITRALEDGGSLGGTFLGGLMQIRNQKLHGIQENYFLSKNFQRIAKAKQKEKKRVFYDKFQRSWVSTISQGSEPVFTWVDAENEELKSMLEAAINS